MRLILWVEIGAEPENFWNVKKVWRSWGVIILEHGQSHFGEV